MKALKRVAAGTMLALALVAGAATGAAAQDLLCYLETDVYLFPDGRYLIIDTYYCS